MSSIPANPHLERALSLARAYIPETILDNWRVVGTTGIMVGLCLCPLIASAWESESKSADPAAARGRKFEGLEEEEEEEEEEEGEEYHED